MNEVLVAVLQLPHSVKGLVSPTPDGDYRVVLNSRLTAEERREVYSHELRHIMENHFSRDAEPVHALEAAAQERGRLQSIIETVEDQGLPGPFRAEGGLPAGQTPEPAPCERDRREAGAAGVGWASFRAENSLPAGQTPEPAPPPPNSLLRARRAQLTGHWY